MSLTGHLFVSNIICLWSVSHIYFKPVTKTRNSRQLFDITDCMVADEEETSVLDVLEERKNELKNCTVVVLYDRCWVCLSFGVDHLSYFPSQQLDQHFMMCMSKAYIKTSGYWECRGHDIHWLSVKQPHFDLCSKFEVVRVKCVLLDKSTRYLDVSGRCTQREKILLHTNIVCVYHIQRRQSNVNNETSIIITSITPSTCKENGNNRDRDLSFWLHFGDPPWIL